MLLIESPEFAGMRGMWNQALDGVLRKMAADNHPQGTVTLKLNIELTYPTVETIIGKRTAKVPNFDYKITTNVPQTSTFKEDLAIGEVEMEYTPETGVTLKRLPGQMTLDQYEEESDEDDDT